MKVLGLILELNPPHKGHEYFINKAKEETSCDICICVLSSSFTMRGEISVIDKFAKAKEAINLGCDFVFELPASLALQSADYFASNAIKILASLGITDIAFGVETNNIDDLLKIKNAYASTLYNSYMKQELASGASYSLASTKSLIKCLNDKELVECASLPNNTLALSYLKALDNYKDINVTLIKRIENDYFDEELNTNHISSASSIRIAIDEEKDITNDVTLTDYDYVSQRIANNKLYEILKYVFISNDLSYFSSIFDCKEGLENRFSSFIDKETYIEFIDSVKTKRYSQNHIKRVIVNMILGITKSYNSELYLRLLAFRKEKAKYLNRLEKEIKEQIFSSLNDSESDIAIIEAKCTKLYELVTNKKLYDLEFKMPIKIGEQND